MVRDSLKLLFLIISYNFILHYISFFSPFPLFPYEAEDVLLLITINSSLYLSWLFGYKEKTVLWIAYVFFFQIAGSSILKQNPEVITQFLPSFLLTLLFIWLFESPMEKKAKELEESKRRLEEEILKNEEEQRRIKEQIELSKELLERLTREKEIIERELNKSKEEDLIQRKALEKEKEELNKKFLESQKKLQDYMERLEKLVKVNRELFQMLELIQEKEPKRGKEELSKLRQERKKLSKELIQMQELLEYLSKENSELNKKYLDLSQTFERLKREKELVDIELERLKRAWESGKEIYREVFDVIFENLEFEDRSLGEYMELSKEAKKEFLKELFLLNMKSYKDRFESMKGYKGVFKLKPRGGRIYFTFGEDRRWKIIGILWGEDEKSKRRYAEEFLVKYKEGGS